MPLTLTESLILANAVKSFGIDSPKLRLYLCSRSTTFLSAKVRDEYDSLKQLAKDSGYIDPVEYCSDMRYIRMLKEYRQRLALINSMEPVQINAADEDSECETIIVNLEETLNKGRVKSYYIYENEVPFLCIKPLGAGECEDSQQKDFQSKVDHMDDLRIPRRIWTRMSDQEKQFEYDYTKIDNEMYFNGRLFQISHERDKALNNAKSASPTESAYENLISRINSGKRDPDGDQNWSSDLKVLMRYASERLRTMDSLMDVSREMERLSLFEHESLTAMIIQCVELLQKGMSEQRSREALDALNKLKSNFIKLGDYYRR